MYWLIERVSKQRLNKLFDALVSVEKNVILLLFFWVCEDVRSSRGIYIIKIYKIRYMFSLNLEVPVRINEE